MSVVFSQSENAERRVKAEALLQTDNDYFVPNLESDKNYTYGIFLGIRLKSESGRGFIFSKKANHYLHLFETGLMGFTPNYKAINFDPYDSDDRPFAGWLYGEYRQIYLFDKAFFSTGIQIGTMGENTNAGKVQNEYHKIAGFDFVPGWETQVPNFIGVNLAGEYQNIFYRMKSAFVYYKGKASIGTVFTNADNRIGLGLGRNPTLFGFTRLVNNQEKNSLFGQIEAGINYTYHDSSIEGNPFASNKFLSDKEFDNSTIIVAFSVKYLTNKWAFIYGGTYESEVVNGADSHRFGRVTIIRAF